MDFRDYKLLPVEVVDKDLENDVQQYVSPSKSARSKSLPKNFSRARDILNQGSKPACVGYAYKLSVDEEYQKPMSAMWIYKKSKFFDEFLGENYDGTSVFGACKMLKDMGVCEESFFPEDAKVEIEGSINNASKYKIKNYSSVMKKMFDLKEAVYNRILVTSFRVNEHFFDTPSNGVVDAEKYMNSKSSGSHAVAIVGWKEIDGVEYLEFQNSWGEYFGCQGKFYMTLDLFNIYSGHVYFPLFFNDDEHDNKIVNNVKNGIFDIISDKILQILSLPFNLINIIVKKIFGGK